MKHIENNLRAIKRRIMLRVWYSYLVSLVASQAALVGLVLGASLVLFFKLVSVTSVLHNLLEVRLGAVPKFIWTTIVSSVSNGEFLKLVSLLMIVASLIYLRKLLRHTTFGTHFVQSV